MKNTFQTALDAWNSCSRMRRRRARYKAYTYGDQWSDTVLDSAGGTSSERDFYVLRNHNPSTSNIIRQLVKTVVGCYRTRHGGSGSDARAFEEFLISGCVIQRIDRRRHPSRSGCVAENVSPARFFIGAFTTDDAGDAEVAGQLHDLPLQRVLMMFSRGDKARMKRIAELYDGINAAGGSRKVQFGDSSTDRMDFVTPCGDMCRVIEVWTMELEESYTCHDRATGTLFRTGSASLPEIDAENARRSRSGKAPIARRLDLTPVWHCRFLAPDGTLLHESRASRHPFVFRFYPLIDGEIHSFVEDIIEHQRNINRLLTLNDRLLTTAAKGVLLFPDSQESRFMPVEHAAAAFAQPDGVVRYRGIAGPQPQQLMTPLGNLGINSMIDRQMSLIGEVSGVTGALRGIDMPAGTSAEMYRSQEDRSLMALADIFDTFKEFIEQRDRHLNSEEP